MRNLFSGLAVLLLVLQVATSPVAASGPAGVDPGDRAVRTGGVSAEATDEADDETLPGDPENVFLTAQVHGNGSAHFRVEYWIRLEDRSDEATFEQYQRRVGEESGATSGPFYERTRQSVDAAEAATGREMSVSDFETRTTVRQIPQRYGVVVYRFRWQGFATVSDRGLRVGDALEGLFLGSGEQLTISWPEAYELESVDPSPDVRREDAVVWRGPMSFGLNGPQLRLAQRAGPASGFLPLGAVAVGVVLVTGFVWVHRSNVGPPTPLATGVFDDGGDDPDLLSNEERVLRLLEEHGGRLKQQEVADEFGWTKSKTSYVVSNLREEGRIETFRLGRENVLSLSNDGGHRRRDS